MQLEYIKETSSWESGGGISLDIVELKDGRILAISDKVVVPYNDMEDLIGGEPSETRPSIVLV